MLILALWCRLVVPEGAAHSMQADAVGLCVRADCSAITTLAQQMLQHCLQQAHPSHQPHAPQTEAHRGSLLPYTAPDALCCSVAWN